MNEKHSRVAVLDDDEDMCKLLRFILQREYEVVIADGGATLLRMVRDGSADVVVLDIGLPDEDGISLARKIRAISIVPIVFLSGHSSAEMIVRGLSVGGDDYITKPFQTEVLLARVRNALRRGVQIPEPMAQDIQLGEVVFSVSDQRLTNAREASVHLTETEALILSALAHAEAHTLSRDEMYRRIYGRNWDFLDRGLEVHLSHLRKKLTEISGNETPISGLRGLGYRLNLK